MGESVRLHSRATPDKKRPVPARDVPGLGGGIANSVLAELMSARAAPAAGELDAAMSRRLGQLMAAPASQRPDAEHEADRLSRGAPGGTPEGVKAFMGQKLGADFSDVRFHTDGVSAARTDAMGADAYASGRDVYFGSGGFDAGVAAHELVHTVQQGAVDGGGVSVSAPMGGVQMVWNPLKAIKNFFTKKKDKPEEPPKQVTTPPRGGQSTMPKTVMDDLTSTLKKRSEGPQQTQTVTDAPPPQTTVNETTPPDYARVAEAKQRLLQAKSVPHIKNVRQELRRLEAIRAALENLMDVAAEYGAEGTDKAMKKRAKGEIKSAKAELKTLNKQLKTQQLAEIGKSKESKTILVGDDQKRSIKGLKTATAMGGVSLLERNLKGEGKPNTEYFKKGLQPKVKVTKSTGRTGHTFSQLSDENGQQVKGLGQLLQDMGEDYGFTPEDLHYEDVQEGGQVNTHLVGKLNTEKREMAVSVMASLLGMGGVVAQSRFGKVTDQNGGSTSGVFIEEAKGISPQTMLETQGMDLNPFHDITEPTGQRGHDKIKGASGVVQRDLMSMQLFDTICGQVDRHHGNLNFQGVGKGKGQGKQTGLEGDTITGVTGFDQDLSFGSTDMHENLSRTGATRSVGDDGELVVPFLDKKFARRVLETDPGAVRKALGDLLPEKDVEAAVKRLKTVQKSLKQEMKKPTGKLLDDDEWGEETHKLLLGDGKYGSEQQPEDKNGVMMRPGYRNGKPLRDINQYQKTMGQLVRGGILSDDFQVTGIGGGQGRLREETKKRLKK